jgi:hypothetical protein
MNVAHEDLGMLNQPRTLRCSVKWEPGGEKAIDVKIPSSKIVAEPDILFRIMHVFLEGYPDYDAGGDLPFQYDPDLENAPASEINLQISDSIICMMNSDKVLACHTKKVEFKYKMDHLRGLKLAMYKYLKDFLNQQKPQQKKVNQNPIDIE